MMMSGAWLTLGAALQLLYPPERKKSLDITLVGQKKEEWAEELIEPRPGVGVVYTTVGSKKENGVRSAFLWRSRIQRGRMLGRGFSSFLTTTAAIIIKRRRWRSVRM